MSIKNPWWTETVFYEIYVPSFRDGDSDGIGDFKGMTEKLDHLIELGVNGVWLTPFYPSPKVDNGYDISDYTEVDSQYGTMEDFDSFIRAAKKSDIKVIIDMVVNHTSTEHEWFKESSSSIHSPKRDWYIWRDEPNNWQSYFGGSAWEYDEQSGQYYYHSFAKEQADLNWNNPQVIAAIYEVLEFWLNKGIAGFRLDVINNLSVNLDFEDNPYNQKGEQVHIYDKDQKGLDEVLRKLVTHIKSKNPTALVVGEISSDDLPTLSHYAQDGLFDLTFNFNIGSLEKLDVSVFFSELNKMKSLYLNNKMPTLFFGSHDLSRSWDRLADNNLSKYKVLLMFLMFSKGIPFIYFGEEFGTRNYVPNLLSEFRDVQGINKYNEALNEGSTKEDALSIAQENTRDGARSPILWDDEKSKNVTYWIGKSEENPCSDYIFAFYKEMIRLRKSMALGKEDYSHFETRDETLMFQRSNIKVYINFGSKRETFNFKSKKVTILAKTGNVDIDTSSLSMDSYSSIIIKLDESEWGN